MSHSKRSKRQQPNRVRCVNEKTGKVQFVMPHIASNPERMAGANLVIAELDDEDVQAPEASAPEVKEEPTAKEGEAQETPAEEVGGHTVTTLRSKNYSPMSNALQLMGGMDKEDLKAFTEGETRKGILNAAAEMIGE